MKKRFRKVIKYIVAKKNAIAVFINIFGFSGWFLTASYYMDQLPMPDPNNFENCTVIKKTYFAPTIVSGVFEGWETESFVFNSIPDLVKLKESDASFYQKVLNLIENHFDSNTIDNDSEDSL